MNTSRTLNQFRRPGGPDLRCVCAFLLVAFATSAQPAFAENPNADIFGRWRVVSVLDTADIAGMSKNQARSLIGSRMRINGQAFSFNGMQCKNPTYERVEREPAQYLREQWHARAGKLGLPDPVTVVDARCTDLFLKAKARMVFNWDGYFFEARKD